MKIPVRSNLPNQNLWKKKNNNNNNQSLGVFFNENGDKCSKISNENVCFFTFLSAHMRVSIYIFHIYKCIIELLLVRGTHSLEQSFSISINGCSVFSVCRSVWLFTFMMFNYRSCSFEKKKNIYMNSNTKLSLSLSLSHTHAQSKVSIWGRAGRHTWEPACSVWGGRPVVTCL